MISSGDMFRALQLNSVNWSHLWPEIGGGRDANAFGETPKCDYKRLNISNFQPRFCSLHPCTSASLGLDLATTPVCSRLSPSSGCLVSQCHILQHRKSDGVVATTKPTPTPGYNRGFHHIGRFHRFTQKFSRRGREGTNSWN